MSDQKILIEDLFLKTLNGDKKAFGEFMILVRDKLVRVSYKILMDYHLAEDIVNDVFLSIAKNDINLKHSKNLSGYLNCIVCNKSLNLLKKKKREIRMEENIREDRNGDPQILEKIRIDIILSEMKENERNVLIYHYHGYTYAETAAFLNTTVSKVRTMLEKAKNNFKTEYLKND